MSKNYICKNCPNTHDDCQQLQLYIYLQNRRIYFQHVTRREFIAINYKLILSYK